MARGNTYTCVVCGKEHTFCPKCQITQPNYDYERYCSKEHDDIFHILSKHGCNLATAEETLDALDDYDITGLTENIQAHINSLKPTQKGKKQEKEVEHDEPTQE